MKHYEIILTHDPDTLQRLPSTKRVIRKTYDDAQAYASYLRKQGLKNRQFSIYVREDT